MEFDDLIEYLDSDANEFGLSALATHGFLTATLVGKPLANWQAMLFEGHQAQVSPDVLTAIGEWRDELQAALQEDHTIELPFDIDELDELMDAEDFDIDDTALAEWSVGFVDAMYASEDEADDWFADADTEEDVAMLTLPMVLFSGIDEEQDDMQALLQDQDTVRQMAAAMEKNLVELYLLFHTND